MPGSFYVPGGEDGNWYNPTFIPKPKPTESTETTNVETNSGSIEPVKVEEINSGVVTDKLKPSINQKGNTFFNDENVTKLDNADRIPNNFPPVFYKS